MSNLPQNSFGVKHDFENNTLVFNSSGTFDQYGWNVCMDRSLSTIGPERAGRELWGDTPSYKAKRGFARVAQAAKPSET